MQTTAKRVNGTHKYIFMYIHKYARFIDYIIKFVGKDLF